MAGSIRSSNELFYQAGTPGSLGRDVASVVYKSYNPTPGRVSSRGESDGYYHDMTLYNTYTKSTPFFPLLGLLLALYTSSGCRTTTAPDFTCPTRRPSLG